MKTGQLTLFTDIINEAVKDDLESKGQVLPEGNMSCQVFKWFKIRKIFGQKSISSEEIIVFYELT